MKKKSVLFLTLLSIGMIGSVAAVALTRFDKIVPGYANHQHVGNHYCYLAPTEELAGHREFWACCECGTQWLKAPEGSFKDVPEDVMTGGISETHIAYLPKITYLSKLTEQSAIAVNNTATPTAGFTKGTISGKGNFVQGTGKSSDVYYDDTYTGNYMIGGNVSSFKSGLGTFETNAVLSAENERQAGVVLSSGGHEVRILLCGTSATRTTFKVIVDNVEFTLGKDNLLDVNAFNGNTNMGIFFAVARDKAAGRLEVYADGKFQFVMTKDSLGIASGLDNPVYPEGTTYNDYKAVIETVLKSDNMIGYSIKGATNFSVIRDYFVTSTYDKTKLTAVVAKSGCERMETEFSWSYTGLQPVDHGFYSMSEKKYYSFRTTNTGTKWKSNESAPNSSNAVFMNNKVSGTFHYGVDVTGLSGTDGTATRAGASVSFGHANTFNYDLQFQYVIWDNTIRVILGGFGTAAQNKYVDINIGFNGLAKPTNTNGFRIELGRKSGEVYVYVQPISNGSYVGELKEAFHYNGDGFVTPNGTNKERQAWDSKNGTKTDALGVSVVGTLTQLLTRENLLFGTSHYAPTDANKGIVYSNFVLDNTFGA